ncbi:MAG TPA: copper amine oxidase N-terminal domain-containing protein [Acetivibrio sp.]|uniref:copper amine oxidase N-terminal domain-containing protein n=1 Tax=Acetivibrio sp. TaxID=1872092 RepID=UPI002C85340D|nr:copper amine oxidase N-terminal domain-containing protein [Acetivibrio sp.]HOM03483.1 copper amine oxidase N-terminal domain-containing protein [Acetivibrio sp.]
MKMRTFCIVIAILLSLFNSAFIQVANASEIKSTSNIQFNEITQMALEDIHHIEIRNGTTGEFVIVKSSKLLEDIYTAFSNATYKIKTDERKSGGWSYAVSFFASGMNTPLAKYAFPSGISVNNVIYILDEAEDIHNLIKNIYDLSNIKVTYAEKYFDFSQVPPYLDNNSRVMVPLRSFCETINASVQWLDKTKEIVIVKDGITINFAINSDTYYVDKSMRKMDTTPVIINDRTYIPVRYIAEAFNMKVSLDGKTRTVSLY